MRLRQIEVFHAVYTMGSITAAAKLLSVSQPAVSKVLSHAEQQLGFALFYRHKGKLLPTEEAAQLIHHVTGAYKNISELRRVAENLRVAEAGQIRIATIPALELDILPRAVASYLAEHPQTQFEIDSLHVQEIISELREHRISVGLAFNPPVTPGIRAEHLASGNLVCLAPADSPLGSSDTLSLEDLAQTPLISLSTRNPLGILLANRLAAIDAVFRFVATVETYQLASALVAQGVGVAIVDEFTARSVVRPEVVVRPLDPALEFNVALLCLENESQPLVTQRFVAHLQSEIIDVKKTTIHG